MNALSPASRAPSCFFCVRPWGLRPRLYAAVRFADSDLTPTTFRGDILTPGKEDDYG